MVALSQKYPEQQFAQVLFPCNQFLMQESGTEEEIARFVKNKFGIQHGSGGFYLMAKSDVNGKKTNETYTWLKGQPGCAGTVMWNFSGKFLVNKDGTVVPLAGKSPSQCDDFIAAALAA
jgi:glutathione peroxidase-family protein